MSDEHGQHGEQVLQRAYDSKFCDRADTRINGDAADGLEQFVVVHRCRRAPVTAFDLGSTMPSSEVFNVFNSRSDTVSAASHVFANP